MTLFLATCGSRTPVVAVTTGPRDIELTATRPDARLEFSVQRASAVELVVSKTANPRGQAFAIQVALELVDDKPGTFALGAASSLPTDRPGTFLLPVPRDAQTNITGKGQSVVVVLTLIPVANDAVLAEPLSVDVRVRIEADPP